jgi:hypothetical protein
LPNESHQAEAIITNNPPTAVDDAFPAVPPGEKVILAGIPSAFRLKTRVIISGAAQAT